jgi:hypothetical protein
MEIQSVDLAEFEGAGGVVWSLSPGGIQATWSYRVATNATRTRGRRLLDLFRIAGPWVFPKGPMDLRL